MEIKWSLKSMVLRVWWLGFRMKIIWEVRMIFGGRWVVWLLLAVTLMTCSWNIRNLMYVVKGFVQKNLHLFKRGGSGSSDSVSRALGWLLVGQHVCGAFLAEPQAGRDQSACVQDGCRGARRITARIRYSNKKNASGS